MGQRSRCDLVLNYGFVESDELVQTGMQNDERERERRWISFKLRFVDSDYIKYFNIPASTTIDVYSC